MKAELLTKGTGQSLHGECSCSNRLKELVIGTPTAARGRQKEGKKKICHYGEVKRSLFLQMFLLPVWFFRFFFFSENIQMHKLHNEPIKQLLFECIQASRMTSG